MPKGSTAQSAQWRAFASRRRDPATKREAVLKTAARLFLEKSYARTSLDDVAARLNITKPALYHYFRSKEEILVECCRLGAELIEETLDRAAAGCRNGLEKVEAFIAAYTGLMSVDYGRCVMRLDMGDSPNGAMAEVRKYKRRIDRRLRAFIQEGIGDGSMAPCDPKAAAVMVAGSANWICQWYEPGKALPAGRIASQFARTLSRGLAAAGATRPDSARKGKAQ